MFVWWICIVFPKIPEWHCKEDRKRNNSVIRYSIGDIDGLFSLLQWVARQPRFLFFLFFLEGGRCVMHPGSKPHHLWVSDSHRLKTPLMHMAGDWGLNAPMSWQKQHAHCRWTTVMADHVCHACTRVRYALFIMNHIDTRKLREGDCVEAEK